MYTWSLKSVKHFLSIKFQITLKVLTNKIISENVISFNDHVHILK